MPPTWPRRPEYDQKPIHGPGFRPAVGPEGPSSKAVVSRPVSLQWRGAREGCGSGACEPLRAPLNQRGGTKLWPRHGQRKVFGPGWWHQPGLKGCIGTGSWHQPEPMPPFSSSWCHQPGPMAAASRPLGCGKEAFGPGWWHQPGLKGAIGHGSWHKP